MKRILRWSAAFVVFAVIEARERLPMFDMALFRNSTFTGANVDALLRQNGVEYVNHPRGVKVENGRITASKIYSWYAGDFGGKGRLKDHWMSLAEPGKAARIASAAISGYEYDWSINAL